MPPAQLDPDLVSAALQSLANALPWTDVPIELRRRVEGEMDAIRRELRNDRPRASVVGAGVRAIALAFEGTASPVLSPPLLALTKSVLTSPEG